MDTSSSAASLVGTWRLVEASSDGRPAFGEKPAGMLMYTGDGHVAVLISHSGRRGLSDDDRVEAPAEERAAAFASFFSYAGRFSVEGGVVRHRVEVSSVENWVGAELVRDLRLDGRRLVLRTPPTLVGGRKRVSELIWERVAE
jgi:hypothetical protein